MKRVHLFEFEDQKWFPARIRNYGTDFLQFLSNKTKMYSPVIPILQKGLSKSDSNQIVDLGSGGGGGLLWLNKELCKVIPELKIVLTDFYPNLSAFELTKKKASNFEYIEASMDARSVSKDLKGLRTMFLSFHHFKAVDAKKILQNAVDDKSPIAVFEGQERSIPSIIAMLFSPLSVLLTTPFIKPFKLGRIIFTYLIPIVPVFVLWDGIVSCLRTYSLNEMRTLVNGLEGGETYDWEIGKVKSGPGVVLYLLGTEKKS